MTQPGTNFFDPLDESAVRDLESMAFRHPFEFGWVFFIAGLTERALHAGADSAYGSGRAAAAMKQLAKRFREDEYTRGLRERNEYMDAMLERLLDRMALATMALYDKAA